MSWYCYLVECADSSLYCGITNNLERRIDKHNTGKGAKYTRGRGPVTLVWKRAVETKGKALRVELWVKSLTRRQKLALIAGRLAVAIIV